MSHHGFRFIHATCLCLDEHLVGTGPLSNEDRELAEEATFRAWDGIVNACISAQAEFLILTGDSFHARTNSLRARVALEQGLEKLAAQDISVFIVPGQLDPASAWKRQLRLPPNVTLLTDEDHEPVAVMRDQRVLASICVIETAQSDESRVGGNGPTTTFKRRQAPFRIGVVAAGTAVGDHHAPRDEFVRSVTAALERADYIALGQGHPRTEHIAGGIAHDPGCAQALSGAVTGARGCSLVNVGAGGDVTIDSLAVAPIRWEEFSLTVERHSNWNDLAERMALAVMERTAQDAERLWIVTWRLTGEGTVFDSLADSAAQQRLWDQVEAELAGEGRVRRIHRVERTANRQPHPQSSPAQAAGLLHEFHVLLNDDPESHLDQMQRDLLSVDWMKNGEVRSLREALQKGSRRRILERARALAAQWLD